MKSKMVIVQLYPPNPYPCYLLPNGGAAKTFSPLSLKILIIIFRAISKICAFTIYVCTKQQLVPSMYAQSKQ